MQNREGVQKGPQDHAEGQQSGNGGIEPNPIEEVERPKNLSHHNAAHRLFEERQQHDEAEKKSEKTRLHREVERRHLDPNDIPEF